MIGRAQDIFRNIAGLASGCSSPSSAADEQNNAKPRLNFEQGPSKPVRHLVLSLVKKEPVE
jgi:hypothetical protein